MRSCFLSCLIGTGVALCGGTAFAQSAADWSGFYVGLNGGWNGGHTSNRATDLTVNQLSGVDAGAGALAVPSITVPTRRPNVSSNGFQGGGQIGFNAVAGPVVWGLEGDFDGMTNSYDTTGVLHLPATALSSGATVVARQRLQPRFDASIRGRVGFTYGRGLFYATGGPAWVRIRQNLGYTYAPTVTDAVAAANPGVAFGPYSSDSVTSDTRRGWTVGGGAELLSRSNMTFGVEYRHTWADGFADGAPASVANTVYETGRTRYRDNAVLARVNVKFGSFPKLF
jgi:outer membrane immunogenic protein